MTGSLEAAVCTGLAGVLGFSAHRAGICNVMAVAEVLTSRRAHQLMSFLKTTLWVYLATSALAWGMGVFAIYQGYQGMGG